MGLARLALMGALSIGCEGQEMAELARLSAEGAVAFTDGAQARKAPNCCIRP